MGSAAHVLLADGEPNWNECFSLPRQTYLRALGSRVAERPAAELPLLQAEQSAYGLIWRCLRCDSHVKVRPDRDRGRDREREKDREREREREPRCSQGKACDRAAWAHSITVAAAKGWRESAASLLLDLAKFYEHVGHDHLWEEGHKTGFPRRLLASWCASFEGWRFLEADKLLDHSPRLQWRHYSGQTHVGNSLAKSGVIPAPNIEVLPCS